MVRIFKILKYCLNEGEKLFVINLPNKKTRNIEGNFGCIVTCLMGNVIASLIIRGESNIMSDF